MGNKSWEECQGKKGNEGKMSYIYHTEWPGRHARTLSPFLKSPGEWTLVGDLVPEEASLSCANNKRNKPKINLGEGGQPTGSPACEAMLAWRGGPSLGWAATEPITVAVPGRLWC